MHRQAITQRVARQGPIACAVKAQLSGEVCVRRLLTPHWCVASAQMHRSCQCMQRPAYSHEYVPPAAVSSQLFVQHCEFPAVLFAKHVPPRAAVFGGQPVGCAAEGPAYNNRAPPSKGQQVSNYATGAALTKVVHGGSSVHS